MTGVGGHQMTARQIKDTEPCGDEHIALIILADGVICAAQNLGRGKVHRAQIADEDF